MHEMDPKFENIFISTTNDEQILLPKMSSEEIDYNTYYDNLYLNDEIVYTRDTSYNFQDTSAEDVLIEIVDQSGGVLSQSRELPESTDELDPQDNSIDTYRTIEDIKNQDNQEWDDVQNDLWENIDNIFCTNNSLAKTSLEQNLDKVSEGLERINLKSNVCQFCKKKFSRKTALISHENNFHENEMAKPLKLTTTRKSSKSSKELKKIAKLEPEPEVEIPLEVLELHPTPKEISVNVPAPLKSKQKNYPCPECAKTFATKQKMSRHLWIHRKKTFCCEICGISCEFQNQLNEHRLTQHANDQRAFPCPKCGRSFVSRQGLWEHDKFHHKTPTDQFKCLECDKNFVSRQGFLIHNRIHTGQKPFNCSYCQKTFRDPGTLRKHERIHTGYRPHVCVLCRKAFNQKSVLREHIRCVHTSVKNYKDPPYQCILCRLEIDNREELCIHFLKHSDKMSADLKKQGKSVATTVTSNSENVLTESVD